MCHAMCHPGRFHIGGPCGTFFGAAERPCEEDWGVLGRSRAPRSGHGLVAGAPVAVSAPEEGGLEADPLVRMSHFSFCALKNSR